MRLIETTQLQLHDFQENAIPPYAILSHTWGESEISHAEFLERQKNKECARYSKIPESCQLALSGGWKYIWIDTCCIDKTSSAELTESINSMYRWYQKAEVCYVYLADISLFDAVSIRFEKSRWFTRGWTLQELLAPERVIFFDKEWNEIGPKSKLLSVISRATSISEAHLLDHSDASVAAKMSWASHRETTRTEDMSYCLLGLFDVNMPLIYGEGEKAFARLQEMIIRTSSDHSIFAWSDTFLEESGLLATSIDQFAESGDVVTVSYMSLDSHPYTITNKGLEATFMAQDCVTGFAPLESFRAILACAWKSDYHRPIYIQLRKKLTGDPMRRVGIGIVELAEYAGKDEKRPWKPVKFQVPPTSRQELEFWQHRGPPGRKGVDVVLSSRALEEFPHVLSLADGQLLSLSAENGRTNPINLDLFVGILLRNESGYRFLLSADEEPKHIHITRLEPLPPDEERDRTIIEQMRELGDASIAIRRRLYAAMTRFNDLGDHDDNSLDLLALCHCVTKSLEPPPRFQDTQPTYNIDNHMERIGDSDNYLWIKLRHRHEVMPRYPITKPCFVIVIYLDIIDSMRKQCLARIL